MAWPKWFPAQDEETMQFPGLLVAVLTHLVGVEAEAAESKLLIVSGPHGGVFHREPAGSVACGVAEPTGRCWRRPQRRSAAGKHVPSARITGTAVTFELLGEDPKALESVHVRCGKPWSPILPSNSKASR